MPSAGGVGGRHRVRLGGPFRGPAEGSGGDPLRAVARSRGDPAGGRSRGSVRRSALPARPGRAPERRLRRSGRPRGRGGRYRRPPRPDRRGSAAAPIADLERARAIVAEEAARFEERRAAARLAPLSGRSARWATGRSRPSSGGPPRGSRGSDRRSAPRSRRSLAGRREAPAHADGPREGADRAEPRRRGRACAGRAVRHRVRTRRLNRPCCASAPAVRRWHLRRPMKWCGSWRTAASTASWFR